MENILLAINGTKLDMNTVDFACYIARITNSRLTGVFMENIIGERIPVLKQLYGLPYVETITAEDFPENKARIQACGENEKYFSQACVNRGVNSHVHINRNANPEDIIAESRFTDLIIVNADISFEKETDGVPSHFVKEILVGAECPIIIAPYSFNEIDELVFAYDGSKSSVFAIKQFAHLFPELSNKKVTVLEIDEKKGMPFSEDEKIKELLKSHYSVIHFEHLVGQPDDELFEYLLGKENLFVIMGAYGRGFISGLLRNSTADLSLKTVNLPFFIAHNK